MRGNFPNVPAQMEVLPFAGRHGENISIQRQKERKRVKKRCFGNGPKVLFLTLSFFCFVSFCKCRYQRERPGVAQNRFMGLKRGYFYICKNRGKAAGPHSVSLYGHTASARRRAVEPVLLNRENGRWAKGGCLGPVPVGCCICRKKSPIVSLVHRGYDRGSSCSGQ